MILLRRATTRAPSSSERAPATQAAAISPWECPTTAAGSTPQARQRPHEGDHDGPQDRLDDVDLIEGGCAGALVDHVEEVPVGEGGQRVGALAHPVGEHR